MIFALLCFPVRLRSESNPIESALPAKTFRRVLHSVMTVSTQRLLEWQAVMHLSARTADRLTKASFVLA